MKCFICDTEMENGAKVCPCCGKIYTIKDMDRLKAYNDNLPKENEPKAQESAEGTNDDEVKSFREEQEDNEPQNDVENRYDETMRIDSLSDREIVGERAENEQTDVDEKLEPMNDAPEYKTDEDEYSADEETAETRTVYSAEDNAPEKKKTLDDEDIPIQGKKKLSGGKKAAIAIVCIVVVLAAVFAVYKVGRKNMWWEKETASSVEMTTDEEVSEPEVTSNPANNKPGYFKITGEQMNAFLYKDPMATASVIATIPRSTVLIVTSVENDKYGLAKYSTYEGYIDLDNAVYLPVLGSEVYTGEDTINSISSEELKGKYVVALNGDSDYLNVRDDATTDGNSIGRLNEGDSVEVVEVKDGWGQISLSGKTGWVYMTYLKSVE